MHVKPSSVEPLCVVGKNQPETRAHRAVQVIDAKDFAHNVLVVNNLLRPGQCAMRLNA
jgi:hypothetical protein